MVSRENSKLAGDQSQKNESLGAELYKSLIRPALFSFSDPEDAHKFAGIFLKWDYPAKALASYSDLGSERLGFNLGGKVHLRGPIGLAAGFDKNAEMLNGLGHIFDYVTLGTALPYRWNGNPRRGGGVNGASARRIVRLKDEESILNCLGFPFDGPDVVLPRIANYKGSTPINLSVAVRPVPGTDQSEAIEKFGELLDRVAPLVPSKVQMIEPNFASPNTNGLAVFFEERNFESLTRLITKNEMFKKALLFLKMPPHLDEATKERNLNIASIWMELGGDGITAINTVKTLDDRLSMGVGGKSGKQIYEILRRNLDDYRVHLGDKPIINAAGGITADKVPELIKEWADTVQVLTSFIYEGPSIVRDSKRALLRVLG